MNYKKLSIVVMPTLLLSLFAMVPINRSYNKKEPWMSKVNDNVRLVDLSIPGTHDSGATHSIFDVAGKCQDTTIRQQLNMGTRFFDLRLVLNNDEFKIIHGPVDQNLKFKKVLKELTSFVKENPSEFLIISIKEESSSVNSSRSFEEVLLENLKAYEEVISFSNELPQTVKEARGKFIFYLDIIFLSAILLTMDGVMIQHLFWMIYTFKIITVLMMSKKKNKILFLQLM